MSIFNTRYSRVSSGQTGRCNPVTLEYTPRTADNMSFISSTQRSINEMRDIVVSSYCGNDGAAIENRARTAAEKWIEVIVDLVDMSSKVGVDTTDKVLKKMFEDDDIITAMKRRP